MYAGFIVKEAVEVLRNQQVDQTDYSSCYRAAKESIAIAHKQQGLVEP